ncbi:DUF2490 domain-containing protein [Rudanella lutea]|uniref:DUF2490 domain-containing protein n=1 Tax=Rudanella lutea TaxID=451374 RepID=UPI00037F4304|nr:DUF2490 domain-containing protein [Rudanella lutea]
MTLSNSCRYALLLALGLLAGQSGYGQRLLDHQSIGWYVYNGAYKLNPKWSLRTEYQWRRIDLIRTWQQSLARLGASYKASDRITFGGGYTYFVTFPFGQYPQADRGVPYPEHRLHADVSLDETYGRLNLTHRFRLEQRWLAGQTDPNPRRITGWEFQNRIRYQIAADLPLHGTTVDNREFYLNFFDEVFIGFGRNVGQNIFNQNRLSAGLGYQVSDALQIELNFLNQVLQHADLDPVSGRPVFEINNGFRLNLNHTLDFGQ